MAGMHSPCLCDNAAVVAIVRSADSERKGEPVPTQGGPDGGSGDSARLDVGELEESAVFFFAKGLVDSSQKTYKSGKNRYLHFCQSVHCSPLPASEETLCKFVSYVACEGLKHCTIRTYLLAIRFLHIRSG